MTKGMGHGSVLRLKHFPTIQESQYQLSKWIFNLKVEILQCFNYFGTRFEGPNPCLNWIYKNC